MNVKICKLAIRYSFLAVLALAFGCCTPEGPESPDPGPEIRYGNGSVVGRVLAGGEALPGVVISDGYLTTLSDADGLFSLSSTKKHGYVFISIPDGYDIESSGNIPQFFSSVGKYAQDTVVFNLKADPRREWRAYVLGDMHLAGKRRDFEQFDTFVKDIEADRRSHPGTGNFAITLGDMTWDAYWQNFNLSGYVQMMGMRLPELEIFHTIGNHDHDLSYDGDWDTAEAFKRTIGPTYYSFNRAGVHFVVLDDIICTNSGGQRSSYNKVDQAQVDWLKQDLQYVPKDTPLAVMLHAPLYKATGGVNLTDGILLINALRGYSKIYFFSGHTHTVYNTDVTRLSGYVPIVENTCGAVCGAWWYTVYDFPEENVHIGTDGAPGGYKVLEIKDGSVSWYFKGSGRPADYQFRTYDRNSFCLDESYVPDATQKNRKGFLDWAEDYSAKSSDNLVYINVWDYDDTWEISVTENDKSLKVSRETYIKDPLYLASTEAYSFNYGYTGEYSPGVLTSYYPGYGTPHIFRVQASSPTSTLTIRVKDRFGRIYSEEMTRPKQFKIEY